VVAFVLSPFLYMHSSLDIPCVAQVSSFMLQSVSIFSNIAVDEHSLQHLPS
jgi:hypothetical protein